ncbi:methyl-accepting chemotaxis protein [Kiloniella sp.]|uniref:methyl-accepting chemotaxis protein n=1 Tax=Kiloniella sp. TaxID=1938587 RepID=UPI003A8E2296
MWSLKKLIFLIAAIPLLVLATKTGEQVLNERQKVNDVTSIVTLAELAKGAGQLVHELQKERSASLVYISSLGAAFENELPNFHTVTNQQQIKFKELVSQTSPNLNDQELNKQFDIAQELFVQLSGLRNKTIAFEADAPTIDQHYSRLIRSLTTVVEKMVLLNNNAELAVALFSYKNLIAAKERASQAQPLAFTLYSSSFSYDGALHRQFVSHMSAETVQLKNFQTFNSYSTVKDAFSDLIANQQTEAFRLMQNTLLEIFVTEDNMGITPQSWYSTASLYLDKLNGLEATFSENILSRANEIKEEVTYNLYLLVGIGVSIFFMVCMFTFVIYRAITKPIQNLTSVMEEMKDGNDEQEIPHTHRTDELGGMARALEVFKENNRERQSLEKDKAKSEREAETKRRKDMIKLAEQLRTDILSAAGNIINTVETLHSAANIMNSAAQKTSQLGQTASVHMQEASTRISGMSNSTNKLSTAVDEISVQASKAAAISKSAVDEVNIVQNNMLMLSEVCKKIEIVFSLVDGVADQTRLLALNATIEASRAGEHGSGFAIVAGEVKALAAKTREATAEIETELCEMRNQAEEASRSVHRIGQTIDQIQEFSTLLSSTVTEQSDSTRGIAAGTDQVSSTIREIMSNMSTVSQQATATNQSSDTVLVSVSSLKQDCLSLQTELDNFIERIAS